MFRHVTSLVLLALPVFACSSSSGGAAASQSLAGHWVSDTCEASGTNYLKRDFTITDTSWDLVVTVYGDAACGTKVLGATIGGDYTVGNASPDVPGARQAEFRFAHHTATPLAQPLVDLLTQNKCGSGTWAIGQTQDILAGGCAPIGVYPVASCPSDSDVVKLDGARLYFGNRPADNDMCATDKRPKALTSAAVVKS
jgi:hypothetical protein